MRYREQQADTPSSSAYFARAYTMSADIVRERSSRHGRFAAIKARTRAGPGKCLRACLGRRAADIEGPLLDERRATTLIGASCHMLTGDGTGQPREETAPQAI